MKHKCENCQHWEAVPQEPGGVCVATRNDDAERNTKGNHAPDAAFANDASGYFAILACGPEFCCKHWEHK